MAKSVGRGKPRAENFGLARPGLLEKPAGLPGPVYADAKSLFAADIIGNRCGRDIVIENDADTSRASVAFHLRLIEQDAILLTDAAYGAVVDSNFENAAIGLAADGY